MFCDGSFSQPLRYFEFFYVMAVIQLYKQNVERFVPNFNILSINYGPLKVERYLDSNFL